jgi:hypothetical protein
MHGRCVEMYTLARHLAYLKACNAHLTLAHSRTEDRSISTQYAWNMHGSITPARLMHIALLWAESSQKETSPAARAVYPASRLTPARRRTTPPIEWSMHPFSIFWGDIRGDSSHSLSYWGQVRQRRRHAIVQPRDLHVLLLRQQPMQRYLGQSRSSTQPISKIQIHLEMPVLSLYGQKAQS